MSNWNLLSKYNKLSFQIDKNQPKTQRIYQISGGQMKLNNKSFCFRSRNVSLFPKRN